MTTQLWCHSISAMAYNACHAPEIFIMHTSTNFEKSKTQIFSYKYFFSNQLILCLMCTWLVMSKRDGLLLILNLWETNYWFWASSIIYSTLSNAPYLINYVFHCTLLRHAFYLLLAENLSSFDHYNCLYHDVPKFLDRWGWANSVDPDQTAPRGAVWSGSTLLAIPSASFGHITLL